MKSTVEQLNPVQYRVSVDVSPEEVDQAFDKAYRNIQKKAKIQGFRPGKAPVNVIRKLYGASVSSDVAETLINTHLFAALNEQTIRPIASPVVETREAPSNGKNFAFSAVVDIMPTIEFDDYKGIPVDNDKYTIKDETIDREIHMLRRRQARTRPVEDGQPAAKGMVAAIAHTAKHEGKEMPRLNVEQMTVALGENEIFEGLENEILGMKVGETKTAQIKVPETYGDAEIAGKTLDFTITVKDLKNLDLPALDDEFAKDLDMESVDQLKKNVREHLELRATDMARQKLEGALLDKIIDKHPFEVPPAMVDQVIDSMIQEMPHQSEDERAKALRNKQLRDEFLPTAKRRTQNTLVLWHVNQKEQLQITDDEVKQRVDGVLASSGISDPKQLSRLRQNLDARVRENLIFEKAMNFLIENAKLTEVPATL
jgi:trigger factor